MMEDNPPERPPVDAEAYRKIVLALADDRISSPERNADPIFMAKGRIVAVWSSKPRKFLPRTLGFALIEYQPEGIHGPKISKPEAKVYLVMTVQP